MNGNRRFNLNRISSNILVWTLPNFLQNDRISVAIQSKKSNSDEVFFTTNNVLIRDFNLDDDFEQYNMINDIPIIQIENRKILMPEGKIITLNNDINSQFLMFQMPRFINGIDISIMGISINYINVIGENDSFIPVNVSKNLDFIRFAWLINGSVSIEPGIVKFEIEIVGTNEKGNPYVFQTLPSQIIITKSLNFDESDIIDRFPTIIESIKIQLNDLKNRIDDLEKNIISNSNTINKLLERIELLEQQ